MQFPPAGQGKTAIKRIGAVHCLQLGECPLRIGGVLHHHPHFLALRNLAALAQEGKFSRAGVPVVQFQRNVPPKDGPSFGLYAVLKGGAGGPHACNGGDPQREAGENGQQVHG